VESNHSIKILNITRVLDNHMISLYWLYIQWYFSEN
jgi:hypothetical protein